MKANLRAARVAATVIVALELARVAALPEAELPGTVPRWLLARTAADILNRNTGDSRIFEAYQSKPKSQSDKKFLLSNLALLTPVPPPLWIVRKTLYADYGDLGPVLRGLADFLGQTQAAVRASKVRYYRAALRSFLLSPAQDFPELDRVCLQVALGVSWPSRQVVQSVPKPKTKTKPKTKAKGPAPQGTRPFK